MDPCTPISSSDPSTSESSRLPSEEAIFPKDLVGQEVNPRKKVYVSQRSEELDNIESNNQHDRTAADDGWNEGKSHTSSTASKTSNEKTMKRRSYRGRHRQFQDQRRPPKPMKPFQQISSSRSHNGHSRMAPRLNLSKSLRAPYGSKWGVKTPQNRTPQSQYRPRTCPSGPSKFTFGSGSPSAAVADTKNWAKLIWESRFRKNVSDIQQAMDRQSDTPRSFLGYDNPTQNQWMQPSSSDTWGHSPKNIPSLFSPHCGVDRRHIMDMLGPIPMPITPPSPMSPLRSLALDPSLGLLDYTAGLNKIDTSPRNPDAVVMNTPTGQFVRGAGGKWFPITPMTQQRQQKLQLQESRAYEEAMLEEARETKQQADRDFGVWCKQRQARSEFVAAITKAAEEPQVVDGAVE